MKKLLKYLIYLMIIILVIIFSIIILKNHNTSINTNYILIKDKKLNVEIANTDSERAKGLMFREKLNYDSGMIFIFEDERIRNFWMKNTLIPLDMIFVDSNLTIVNIIDAEPCKIDPCKTYSSIYPAKYVIETNKGYFEKNKINVGDKVKLLNI